MHAPPRPHENFEASMRSGNQASACGAKGGRKLPGDDIDPAVGFVVTAKPGDKVERGQPVATVHARDEAGLQLGLAALGKAIVIGEEARPLPVVMHRVTVADMDPSP